MTDRPDSERPLRIHQPCTKTWASLVGGEGRRFCSECSLHVHDAAALTRDEAVRLVRESTGRVCMRIEYDPQGNAVFRDSPGGRLARWTLSAAAGLLAACHGAPADPASGTGGAASVQGAGAEPEPVPVEAMGRTTEELGDVALPPDGPEPPEPTRLLGEVSIDPGPPNGGGAE
jgi:hypothetical protein